MLLKELLTELSFQGRKCTKDCGGHSAGYAWAVQKGKPTPCNSHSVSFNNGCEIANDQIKKNQIKKPKVRNNQGRFAPNPQVRQSIK